MDCLKPMHFPKNTEFVFYHSCWRFFRKIDGKTHWSRKIGECRKINSVFVSFDQKDMNFAFYANVAQTKHVLFVLLFSIHFCFIFIFRFFFWKIIFFFVIFSKGISREKIIEIFFWSQTILNYNFDIHINKDNIYTDCRIKVYVYYIYIWIIDFQFNTKKCILKIE